MSHSSASTDAAVWLRWLIVGLVLSTLAFGFCGLREYDLRQPAHKRSDWPSWAYHSLQLIALDGEHLHGPIPWQVHAARFLGAAALFAVGISAVVVFFRHQAPELWLHWPWLRGHVVICGLSDLGMRLATDARHRGKFVVAIEKASNRAAIDVAHSHGIAVLEGDAYEDRLLRKAKMDRSELVVAACNDDRTNVAVAASVRRLSSNGIDASPPLCRVVFHNPKLSELLADPTLWPGPNGAPSNANRKIRVNLRNLDLLDTAARQAVRAYPLDFQPIRAGDNITVRLIVVGFGEMGHVVARHAARIGQFANAVVGQRRLKITIVDRDAATACAALRGRYPHLDKVCDVEPHVIGCDVLGDVCAFVKQETAEPGKYLTTCALCLENDGRAADDENLIVGLSIAKAMKDRKDFQTLIYQSTRQGYPTLLAERGRGMSQRLHAFGMIEDLRSWSTLLDEGQDEVAHALHQQYATGPGGASLAQVDWECLPESLRDSNRQAADHIPIKLRALGYHEEPRDPAKPAIEEFTDDEVELLAQMEHLRWCAERWLSGWDIADETNREGRRNKNLCAWSDLDAEERTKDEAQIQSLVEVLKNAGRGIYR